MHIPTLALVCALGMLLAGCAGPAADNTTSNPTGGSPPATPAAPSSPFPLPSATTKVTGSGATFPKPLLEHWGFEYAKKQSKVQVSYAGGGSGKGIGDITKKDVLFAGSDAPLSATEKSAAEAGGNVILQFPETLGLVALVYKHDSLPNHLKLDGETAGKMFSGAIKKWNDPAIAQLNPDVALPDLAVSVAVRSDSSGTTFAFTDWLTRVSPTFASTVTSSAAKAPDWTKSSATVHKGNGNDGVATNVNTVAGALGYVELSYAGLLKVVDVRNKAGNFVAPTTQGASAAAEGAASNLPAPEADWSHVTIADADGADAYPISTFTYILVFQDLSAYGGKFSADQMNAFRNWMWYAIHEGQADAPALGYAPLPAPVVTLAKDALQSITA